MQNSAEAPVINLPQNKENSPRQSTINTRLRKRIDTLLVQWINGEQAEIGTDNMDSICTEAPRISELEKPLMAAKKDSGVDLMADIQHHVADPLIKEIPPFYFPKGKPLDFDLERTNRHSLLKSIYPIFVRTSEELPTRVRSASNISPSNPIRNSNSLASLHTFSSKSPKNVELETLKLTERQFINVTKALGIPRYLNKLLFFKVYNFDGITAEESIPRVSFRQFARCWKSIAQKNHDIVSLTFSIICKKDSNIATVEDIEMIVHDVVEHHPGLSFLNNLTIFQQRYVETVATRIFIEKSRSWNNAMTLQEYRKMNFIDTLFRLDNFKDINHSRDVFSYKHFYVIYCKFWELDTDHDLLLSAQDIYRYDDGGILWRAIDRCVDGAGLFQTKHPENTSPPKMSFREFVYFVMAVEDKSLPSSIEYWFRVLDMDGDGIISLYELQWFWEEHVERICDNRGSEFAKFSDFVCSMQVYSNFSMDILQPQKGNMIKLSDLKKCSNSALVLDMIFDIGKYESRMRKMDPLSRELDQVWVLDDSSQRVRLEGWEKFAERTYEQLALEERRQQQIEDLEDCDMTDQEEMDLDDSRWAQKNQSLVHEMDI